MSRDQLKNVVVVLAGGEGTRAGLGIPKQFVKVAGKTIIEHTLTALQEVREVDEIVVVMAGRYIDAQRSALRGEFSKVSRVVPGGRNRNESTQAALGVLGSDECKVLVHDAVRPFIDREVVVACIEALDVYDAVDVTVHTPDTMVVVDEADTVIEIPDRRFLRRGQTPQGFLLSTLRKAYELAAGDDLYEATDDCGVVLRYLPETTMKSVSGTAQNMKVTYAIDVAVADKLFQIASRLAPDGSGEALKDCLAGKTLVVFGGSYGIGHAIATVAQKLGADVFSYSRSETSTDITSASGVENALRAAFERTGRIDFIANTAATLVRSPLAEMSVASIEDNVATNYVAAAIVARASLPYLRETSGSLLLFTSSSYTRGRAGYSIYSSSKAAVVNLTQALSDEWDELSVRVNCLNPERTRTPMRSKAFGDEPIETLLAAEDVAHSALAVLTSSWTGHVIDVRRPQDE